MNDVKSVKEFAEKNAGKKFKGGEDSLVNGYIGAVAGYCNGHILLVMEDSFTRGHTCRYTDPILLQGFEIVEGRMYYVDLDGLTPIETPSGPQKPTKKQRKVAKAWSRLKEHMQDVKDVLTGFNNKTGKLQTIVILQNGTSAKVSLKDGEEFDAYKAIEYAREKAIEKTKVEHDKKVKAAIELLKAEGDRQEALAEARRLVRPELWSW